ncbi:uncharacterized protein METZ01_LOCUS507780 [marine metagenome]|uniref:Uncharacterized protein n=1 Tax=marine metagenome TaxID=408172 RepID=A0A383EDK7_9ZZZZ
MVNAIHVIANLRKVRKDVKKKKLENNFVKNVQNNELIQNYLPK